MEDFCQTAFDPVLYIKADSPQFAGDAFIVKFSLHIELVVLLRLKFILKYQIDIYCLKLLF